MKKIISIVLTFVMLFSFCAGLSMSAEAAASLQIKRFSNTDYLVQGDGPDGVGGCVCTFMKFNKVKGASYYQLKYKWYGGKAHIVKLKKNRFHFDGQDLPTMKVRAVKVLQNGKKRYGKWKKVRFSGDETAATLDFKQHERMMKKLKYQTVEFEY